MKKISLAILAICFAASCTKYEHVTSLQEKKVSGQLLSDWISVQLRLIKNTTGLPHVAYSRHFAYTSIAFYESLVPGSPGYKSLAGQLRDLGNLPIPDTHFLCWEAAANSAYAALMRTFYSANKINPIIIDSMETAVNNELQEQGYAKSLVINGNNFGNEIGQAVVSWAASDGSNSTNPVYVPPVGDGLWIPTPPAFAAPAAPYWGNNKALVSHSIDNAMAPPPMAFSSEPLSPFYKTVNDLYLTSLHLTDEQKSLATYWDDSPNGKYVTAYGHWASILAQQINKHNFSLIKAAEAYAAMCISMNDASISCWKAKYTYNRIRPVSYIRLYIGDSNWLSYITTPAHPEYPAAHSTLSYAAATALTHYLGNFAISDNTYENIGMSARTYSGFLDAAKAAGDSRFLGGIHLKPSINAGAACGTAVAKNVAASLHFGSDEQ